MSTMDPRIQLRVEPRRGCGFRKPGGIYLVADGPAAICGKLPIPLEVCPCCGVGIKPCRGWTWVNGTQLAAAKGCSSAHQCLGCPLAAQPGRVGLLWVGEKFYATPDEWTREAQHQGVSRRLSTVPRDFVLGETWVWMAHRKAILNPDGTWTAGVFRAFRPQRVEYVCTGDESKDQIDALIDRGLTPVKVEHAGETKPLFSEQGATS
jgi:hypothetical protein